MKGLDKWVIVPHHLKVAFTNRYLYAWIIREDTGQVVAQASTVEAWLRDRIRREDTFSTADRRAAAVVGTLVAERAKEQGVQGVLFRRCVG